MRAGLEAGEKSLQLYLRSPPLESTRRIDLYFSARQSKSAAILLTNFCLYLPRRAGCAFGSAQTSAECFSDSRTGPCGRVLTGAQKSEAFFFRVAVWQSPRRGDFAFCCETLEGSKNECRLSSVASPLPSRRLPGPTTSRRSSLNAEGLTEEGLFGDLFGARVESDSACAS